MHKELEQITKKIGKVGKMMEGHPMSHDDWEYLSTLKD